MGFCGAGRFEFLVVRTQFEARIYRVSHSVFSVFSVVTNLRKIPEHTEEHGTKAEPVSNGSITCVCGSVRVISENDSHVRESIHGGSHEPGTDRGIDTLVRGDWIEIERRSSI